jgi:hypothetical protein
MFEEVAVVCGKLLLREWWWLVGRVVKLLEEKTSRGAKMVGASKEMAVYCFDTLVAHYTGDVVPDPGFEQGQL